MTALRQRMLEDLRIRNYAPTTVAAYIRSVADFAQHFHKPPDQLGAEEVRTWQLFLLHEKRAKLPTYIQAVCALRFFYQNTLRRKIEIDRIPLPRYEKKLPAILSKAEVKTLLETPQNLKHRAMLATMYAAGLRVSEVAKLKVADLDRERHAICWQSTGGGIALPCGCSRVVSPSVLSRPAAFSAPVLMLRRRRHHQTDSSPFPAPRFRDASSR